MSINIIYYTIKYKITINNIMCIPCLLRRGKGLRIILHYRSDWFDFYQRSSKE